MEEIEDGKWVEGFLPMVEGRCPPITRMRRDGVMESCYPVPDPDYVDEEIYETETYCHEDKDEFWGYVTRCKKCRTRFQAYDIDWESVNRYCPGCGAKLN